MIIEEIISKALLGTHGAPLRLPALTEELAAVLPALSGDPESQLLDAAAGVFLYARAGGTSHQGISPPQLCPADRWSECSPRAANILAQAFEDRLQPLLVEWLELASSANRRPPHALLPTLLDIAAGRKALQPLAAAVIDERGRWLTQFNPRWQFTTQSVEPSDEVWQTGNPQQRAESLRTIRQSTPAKARELVASTWQDDGADERTQWVNSLLVHLSAADEDFLETCLDDRSGRVREAAAALLARLPNSKFVGRMTDRLRPLVTFTPGASGQLLKLKRATKASLEVRLPEAFEKAMQRDGMTEKPSEALGPKQWWLMQIIAGVPLTFWTETFNSPPTTLIDSLPSEFSSLFVRGWLAALSRTPVAEWIEPLINAAGSDIRIDEGVLHAVPPQQRPKVLQLMLKAAGQQALDLSKLLEDWRPLDESVSQIVLNEIDLRLILMSDAHFHLHPRTLQTLEAQLIRDDLAEYRRKADQALTVIFLRSDLFKEFCP